jgi:hypothetical protein
MKPRGGLYRSARQRRVQDGMILLVLALVLLFGGALVLFNSIDSNGLRQGRDANTQLALAEAKRALIAHIAGREIDPTSTSIFTLPCPDLNDDGLAETSCGNASGSTQQTSRIGRLPWRTLGISDLRDGSGERLWYAVSSMYKNNTANSNLNPTTGLGTITVRDATGNLLQDGTLSNPYFANSGGAVAVIIAPGDAIIRQGSSMLQDRSCSGGACGTQGECTSSPASLTAKCNPVNYLDIAIGEDNANFVDNNTSRASNGNGFIAGPVLASGTVILNDRLAVVGYEDIMPAIQRRVGREVLNCFTTYAAANRQRYPWPAPTCRQAATVNWSDHDSVLFGRIPDTGPEFNSTVASSGSTMSNTFPATSCMLISGSGWWTAWKMHVFYALADAHKPALSGAGDGGPCSTASSCLRIVDPSGNTVAANKQVAVIVAGRPLNSVMPPQVRTGNNDAYAANYLEKTNVSLESMIIGTLPGACNGLSPAVVSSGCSPLSNCNAVTAGNRESQYNDVVAFFP